jgi:hypothetical protein
VKAASNNQMPRSRLNRCFDYRQYLSGSPLHTVVELLYLSVLLVKRDMTNLLLTLCLVTCFSVPVLPNGEAATQADRETVLQACATVFGPPVDSQNGLFEVNRFFVLEAKFDSSGRLTQLGVLPKHWFADDHPEWEEVEDVGELTEREYESLLVQLDRVRPKGRIVQRAKFPIVTNSTARSRDIYKRAVLETGDVVEAQRPDDAPRAIKYFIVYFTATRKTK